MAYISLAVETPHATAYDAEYPTRSTEMYSHNLHEVMQDMEDASGDWFLSDGIPSTVQKTSILQNITDNVEVVFNYAESAIAEHRAEEAITLVKPAYDDLDDPSATVHSMYAEIQLKNYMKCMQTMWLIYYMWKTEEDPLLLKEKLQELLIAWPLTDSEIILNEVGGQSIRIVPAWKNVDI